MALRWVVMLLGTKRAITPLSTHIITPLSTHIITPLSTHIIVDFNTRGASHMGRCRLSICLAKRSFSCRPRGRSFLFQCTS